MFSDKPEAKFKLQNSEGKESKTGFGLLYAQVGQDEGPVLKIKKAGNGEKCLLDHLCAQMGYEFAVDFFSEYYFSNVIGKRKDVFRITKVSCNDESRISTPTFQISKIKIAAPELTYVLCGPPGVCPITEKRNFLMRVCFEDFEKEILQCPFSHTIYTSPLFTPSETYAKISAKCDNDPFSYQGCGIRNSRTFSDLTINEAAICGNFICSTLNTSLSASSENIQYLAVSVEFVCGVDKTCIFADKNCLLDELQDCWNQEIPEDLCSTEYETVQLPTGRIVPKFKVCNGRCDDHYQCEDEAMCGGYIYGKYCMGSFEGEIVLNYINPGQLCDGEPYHLCLKGEDEIDCPKVNSNASLEICEKIGYLKNTMIPLTNRTRCSAPWKISNFISDGSKYELGQTICSNFLDQTNCTAPTRSTVICKIRGMMSNVSRFFVCHGQSGIPALCDNGIDQECSFEQIFLTCKLHKHQLCDSVNDCLDGSDEKLEICRSMTERTCYRAYKL